MMATFNQEIVINVLWKYYKNQRTGLSEKVLQITHWNFAYPRTNSTNDLQKFINTNRHAMQSFVFSLYS